MIQQLVSMSRLRIWQHTAKPTIMFAISLFVFGATAAFTQTFTTLHGFTGGTDGGFSFAPLILDPAGNLYGTTYQGGDLNCDSADPGRGCGVVYRMDSAGNQTVLYSFRALPDGQFVQAGLVRDNAGNLYGTTTSGGDSNAGTVFKLDVSGKEN